MSKYLDSTLEHARNGCRMDRWARDEVHLQASGTRHTGICTFMRRRVSYGILCRRMTHKVVVMQQTYMSGL